MRFDTSQQMKLGQQMKLAPRMIQSMEILQLPMLALQERIEQELESNITLETADPGEDGQPVETDNRDESGSDDAGDRELSIDESGESDFERLDSMESSYKEAFENEYSSADRNRSASELEHGNYSPSRMSGERDGKMDAMANTAARGPSYTEQLLEQWSMADVDEQTRETGDLIISYIDENGYLHTPLETIADRSPADREKPDIEYLENVLRIIQQTLEPVGLGARDTVECLTLQLDAMERERAEPIIPTVRTLITEHLDDLTQNRLPRIAQKTGLGIEQIKEAVQWMHRLTVAPGRHFVTDSPPAIIPDAVIEYDEDGDRYIARLHNDLAPTLRINPSYARMARDRAVEKPTRDFIRTNLSNAQWLIDAVNQRNHTLMRVISVVADAQREFFEQGPQALRPLPMTQVADQLGVHVATVSRAVAGKYVQTPRGVMPLRSFFSGGAQTDSGEEMSWDAIKAVLQEIVDAENKSNPLSDEALADKLRERGVDIARRTIAKYRNQLNIPSARMRKEY
ncbi:MAG: RNA polymerase sigma-54 factor [Phycisphaeraceae bacterium]|nr:MAG: RNA polymerase sigma-54 factor [Phycisphaeraceae bacterium]